MHAIYPNMAKTVSLFKKFIIRIGVTNKTIELVFILVIFYLSACVGFIVDLSVIRNKDPK